MARLYANENFPLPVVERLRQYDHDVLTIQEIGRADQAVSDEEVLTFASEDGRAVLTLNRKHFIRLHQMVSVHRGIIVCTFDPDFERQAKRIHEALTARDLLSNELIRVNRPST